MLPSGIRLASRDGWPSLPGGSTSSASSAIPSVSADPAHAADVTRAAERVAGAVAALGGEADLHEARRLVVGGIAGPPGAPVVLVYGRYDVQPRTRSSSGRATRSSPSLGASGLRAGSRTTRDSSGCSSRRSLHSSPTAAPVSFRVVCDGEEETGGDAINRFLAADHEPVDACVIFDGWMKRRNRPFVVATRGLVALDLEVRTGERVTSIPGTTAAPR